LVERGLPGLNLNYLSVPPAAVTPRPEFHYFSVDRSGPCWDHIVKTGTVGLHVHELSSPEFELLAILD
nr:type VI secretion system baseplate subunit TssK [Acidobacteriota bacterium]